MCGNMSLTVKVFLRRKVAERMDALPFISGHQALLRKAGELFYVDRTGTAGRTPDLQALCEDNGYAGGTRDYKFYVKITGMPAGRGFAIWQSGRKKFPCRRRADRTGKPGWDKGYSK
jgi:hypothetical protein